MDAPWRTLLVPTDFSECSDRALGVAAMLARLDGAKIVLLHASELTGGVAPSTPLHLQGERCAVTAGELLRTSGHEQLRAQITRAGEGMAIEARVAIGGPEECIREAVEEVHADAIVMGTHGRTGISHMLVGSVAERVLRTSRVPVVTVRQPDSARHASRTDAERALEDETSG